MRTKIYLLLLAIILVPSLVVAATESESTYDKLQKKIQEKQTVSDDLQDKISVYKENIKSKQQEALTLESQLEVLDENIALTETNIKKTETDIDKLENEIEKLQIDINNTQSSIDKKKDSISELIRNLHSYDQQTYLEIALSNNTLSEFSSQIQYTNSINKEFKNILDDLKDLKTDLQEDKAKNVEKKDNKKEKKVNLLVQKDSLEGQITIKEDLKTEVEADEEKFQQLVKELQSEQSEINASISSLEKKARSVYEDIHKNDNPSTPQKDIVLPTDFTPMWPVNGPITATFHDPSYIFRRYFEHDAIDIAAPQGTALRAADSGVVSVVRFDGSTRYAFVSIVHADNYSTLYGHVSAVYVSPEEVVEKGQVIAAVGGTPGTPGAGAYTTGPHVHFGVRLNGIPVDPQLYLP